MSRTDEPRGISLLSNGELAIATPAGTWLVELSPAEMVDFACHLLEIARQQRLSAVASALVAADAAGCA
jgi:hypothetical protein